MIKFTKMHGLGNDYVYINCTKEQHIKDISNFAKLISDRHFGIGADGLIIIYSSNVADFKMRMFNFDGTEAEMCGNGIRCVGKYVYDKGLTQKKEVTIETLSGIKNLKLHINEEKVETVEVDMGVPILKANKIPVISEEYPVKKLNIKVEDREFIFTCVSMGNPHAITIVENVNEFDIQKYGKILETNKAFPNKTNVEFIELIDEQNIKMRVWERGTGETLACGTGACAAVVACNLNNYIKEEVNVKLLGGKLRIKWDKEVNHVYMTGPATEVFEGEISACFFM